MKMFYGRRPIRNNLIRAAVTAGILATVTILGLVFNDSDFIETAVILACFFAVIIVAWLTDSFVCCFAAATLSALIFDFFFTDPYYRFIVYDTDYVTIFLFMSIASLISGSLTLLARRNALIARKNEEETEKERYRTNLLRSISHDIRTPLSAIIGTAEMLEALTPQDDPRYTMARNIRDETNWLRSLVENILSLTRLQNGDTAIPMQLEAVEEVVASAVQHMLKRSPGLKINVDIPDELLLVPMDAKLIVQVLLNLLDNAVRHTPSGGSVSIAAEATTAFVRFSVLDEGEGISGEVAELFQPFYTTNTKHADAESGVGLGLAICETIVKAHGGDISARNRAGKSGAEFTFTLPKEE